MSSKRRKRYTPERIVRKLRDADAMLSSGKELAAVLLALEVSDSTLDRWRNHQETVRPHGFLGYRSPLPRRPAHTARFRLRLHRAVWANCWR